ncbi:hypothetical protein NC652_012054 [Populus alba x Populus x berolinensis]|nr:hypothetical protein NC652_012054 [Populus alba x Populus x berolinensis]
MATTTTIRTPITALASPPTPPPSDLTVPVPAPAENVPDPDPSVASDINVKAGSGNQDDEEEESEGMSGGEKAGIAAAVIGAACLVGFGGLVYKKRQDNIRRSAYGYAARRELL